MGGDGARVALLAMLAALGMAPLEYPLNPKCGTEGENLDI
jgi:hypothetical protein